MEDNDNYLEIVNDNCEFHCLCFNHRQPQHDSMKERFQKVGLDLKLYKGVPHTDPRIMNNEDRNIGESTRRAWSIVYGHLDMIQQFYDSGKSFGFFCEDDIVIHKDLPKLLPNIMEEFGTMNLDLLLLGYMKTYKVEHWMSGYDIKQHFEDRPYTYHCYPDQQWGVHLYMVCRKGAKLILDTYANGYADENVNNPNKPFSPDWTISKIGNRALISPMYAVEDGKDTIDHYGHWGQYLFHRDTFEFNFIPDIFI